MTWLISLYSWWLQEQGEVTAAAYFRSSVGWTALGHSPSEQRPCISLRAKSSGRGEDRQITSRAVENQKTTGTIMLRKEND